MKKTTNLKTTFYVSEHQQWPFVLPWTGCAFVAIEFDEQQLTISDLQNLGFNALPGKSKRQAEFIAGRYCASQALGRFLDGSPVPARLPDSGLPDWPQGFCGSISHSHGWAAACAAADRHWQSLGLDLERAIAPARAERLQKAVLLPEEQQLLTTLPDWTLADFITCVFSAKESLFKTLNPLTGKYFGFQDAQITLLDGQGRLELCLLKELAPDWPLQSRVSGQWARYAHGFITMTGVPAS